jgi:hypothetical protein
VLSAAAAAAAAVGKILESTDEQEQQLSLCQHRVLLSSGSIALATSTAGALFDAAERAKSTALDPVIVDDLEFFVCEYYGATNRNIHCVRSSRSRRTSEKSFDCSAHRRRQNSHHPGCRSISQGDQHDCIPSSRSHHQPRRSMSPSTARLTLFIFDETIHSPRQAEGRTQYCIYCQCGAS